MSDSSDHEVPVKVHKKKGAAAAVVATPVQDYSIKSEKGEPSVDTSSWPLLLKVTLVLLRKHALKLTPSNRGLLTLWDWTL